MIKQKTNYADDPRFDVDMKHYNEFTRILKHVEDGKDGKEMFPRPLKNNDPLTSYGTILFREDEDSIHYFTCQRRTTIEFAEIVKCGPRKDRLFYYFSNMTEVERTLLCNKPHNVLWNDLLLSEKSLFNETKAKVGTIFEAYQHILPTLIDMTTSITTTLPYEFTKGRPNLLTDRSHLGTAVRELREEGGINLGSSVDLVENITAVDVYKGTDNILYQTNYYLIRSPELFEPEVMFFDVDNCVGEHCISTDMKDYEWVELHKDEYIDPGSTPLCPRLESLLFKVHEKLCSTL